MKIDHFAHKADNYENRERADTVGQIADAMRARIAFNRSMRIMDFGSGTGLLLAAIAPHVHSIAAVDVSPSMNVQLRDKLADIACPVEMIELDLEQSTLDRKFDGVISSMTMHHIKDVAAMLKTFHALLNDGGFIAIADLEREDGSFHGEEPGVHHLGFEPDTFAAMAVRAGFKNVTTSTATVIQKPQRDYPIFLSTATR